MKKKIISKIDLDMWLDGGMKAPEDFQMPQYFQAPISLIWELTGKCLSNCIYCSGGFPKKTAEMTTEQRMCLADELIDMKIFMISLSGGDPLLCDDLEILVEKFTKAQIPTMICTPGLAIDETMMERLCKNPLVAFNVSLDSIHPEINDFQRGRKGACEQALKLISLIDRYGQGRNFTSVEMVVTRKNYGEIKPLIQEMTEHCVNEIRIQPVISMNEETYEKGLALSSDDPRELKSEVSRVVSELSSNENANEILCVRYVDQSRAVIKGIKTGMNWGGIISPEGDLQLSGYIPYIYGNLFDYANFKEAWDQGFCIGWKKLQRDKGLTQIKDVMDLQKVFKEKGFKRYRYE